MRHTTLPCILNTRPYVKRRDRRQELSPADIFIAAEGRLCNMFGVVLQCVDRQYMCVPFGGFGGGGGREGDLIVTAEGYCWLKKMIHDAEVTD